MSLVNYDISDGSEESEEETTKEGNETTSHDDSVHSKPEFALPNSIRTRSNIIAKVNSTPEITLKEAVSSLVPVNPQNKELTYNPRYEELFAPEMGPTNPNKPSASKNMLSGFVEEAHINSFQFELQRQTFHNLDYAADPTEGDAKAQTGIVGNLGRAIKTGGQTLVELGSRGPTEDGAKAPKRKKVKNNDSSDVDGYLGPWARYEDEEEVAKPSEADKEFLQAYLSKMEMKSKRRKRGPGDAAGGGTAPAGDEKSTLHIESAEDYQGRSFILPPKDIPGVNFSVESLPQKCFVPKRLLHDWSQAHSRGVASIRLFPGTGHLLLSAGMDSKVKLWELYRERRLVRSYLGHKEAVRDLCFNNTGSQFLSASYDRTVKLWDTETGACISRFGNGKKVYCVRFNPDDDKQNFFLAGTADKKILCFDTRSGEVTQEYDRHLGAVNSITFVDNNRRFVTTSDDNSLRVWEWDIAVDFKHLADPNMQSMPTSTLSPNGKWLVCQSMDNKIVVFNVLRDFKRMTKKTFGGHMSAGYACNIDFSPEMTYLVSGDGDGKCFIWNFKTRQIATRWKAHDGPCVCSAWMPHETSKVVTAGWDGNIKLWD